jgi:hypothetical protein
MKTHMFPLVLFAVAIAWGPAIVTRFKCSAWPVCC